MLKINLLKQENHDQNITKINPITRHCGLDPQHSSDNYRLTTFRTTAPVSVVTRTK